MRVLQLVVMYVCLCVTDCDHASCGSYSFCVCVCVCARARARVCLHLVAWSHICSWFFEVLIKSLNYTDIDKLVKSKSL